MSDAPFIVAGWVGSAAALAAYAVSVRLRLHRARVRATSPRETDR